MLKKILNKLRWFFTNKCVTCGGTFIIADQHTINTPDDIYGPTTITKLKCDKCGKEQEQIDDNDPFTFP